MYRAVSAPISEDLNPNNMIKKNRYNPSVFGFNPVKEPMSKIKYIAI